MEEHLNSVLEYQARLSYNRQVFLLNHGEMVGVFSRIDENFITLREILHRRDTKDNSHCGLLPFLLLMQRQTIAAFDSLQSHQANQAWTAVRPCLEAALIVGRFVDDPSLAQLWMNPYGDFEKYKREFQGKRLRSKSLPGSDRIQWALSRVNDEFMHINIRHLQNHVTGSRVGGNATLIEVQCFTDDTALIAALYAVCHLILVVQDSVLRMFKKLFSGLKDHAIGLEEFENLYQSRAITIAKSSQEAKAVLEEFGLWRFATQKNETT